MSNKKQQKILREAGLDKVDLHGENGDITIRDNVLAGRLGRTDVVVFEGVEYTVQPTSRTKET